MQDELFELGDLFGADHEGRSHLATIVGLIIRAVLAITTAGFFFIYAGAVFTWLVGPYSPWVAAALGVFMIDFLAWGWDYFRRNSATTLTQTNAARIGTVGNMAMSALVTLIFFILNTSFVDITNPDGSYNIVGEITNILGITVITVSITGNAVLWAYYEANGSNARQALQNIKLAAARNQGDFRIQQARTQEVVNRTTAGILERIPQAAQHQAGLNSDQYVTRHFPKAPGAPRGTTPSPPPANASLYYVQRVADNAFVTDPLGYDQAGAIMDELDRQAGKSGTYRIVSADQSWLNQMQSAPRSENGHPL